MSKKIFKGEKDVETHFRKLLEEVTGSHFVTFKKGAGQTGGHWETDGVLDWESPAKTPVRVLLEAKFNTSNEGVPQASFTEARKQASVLAQALYYCKRFECAGEKYPKVILLGDEQYCFAVSFDAVRAFLDSEIEWSRAPSSPDVRLTQDVERALGDDGSLRFPLPKPTLSVDGEALKKLCEELAEGCLSKVKPSEMNIAQVFQEWNDKVIGDNKNDMKAVLSADVFYACLLYPEARTKEERNTAHIRVSSGVLQYRLEGTKWNDVEGISTSAIENFFTEYQRGGFTADECTSLLSVRDRLIEEEARRWQGAFYTPSDWVKEAHSEMEEVLGAKWREECIVWDCCAGTGNLTRGKGFKNLVLSTAEAPDVRAIKREGHNRGAHVFQYDFLNPEAESSFFEGSQKSTLPSEVEALLKKGAEEGKRLVFLINPPYATAAVKGEASRKGVASTIANSAMKEAKLGACSQQLYAQFLFQCEQVASEYGFRQKSVGIFSPISFMVSGSFAKFRPFWYERYSYQSGFMFRASHFADVKGSWAISFTLWNEGETEITQDLPLTLKDKEGKEIISLSEKHLYNADGRKASDWVREPAKGLKGEDAPHLKSGLCLTDKGYAKHIRGSLLYMNVAGNNIQQAGQLTGLYASSFSNAHGLSVLAGEGWRRALSLYSARRLSKDTWVTHNDEYLAPQTQIEGYDQWVDDCHVYALLHSSNNMTSMRDVEYKGQKWNIHNHFFWLTRQEALDLYGSLSDSSSKALHADATESPIPHEKEVEMGEDVTPEWRRNGDPYFSHILPTLNLSPLAKEIMEDLKALFIKSLPYRDQVTHEKGQDLHLGAWDAGIYQHKKLWAQKPTLKADWETLKVKHRQLAQSLEQGVFTYGFLKK
jgi:hypothetical protein